MDPHYFGKLDPHKSGKLDLDPDTYENQISGSLEAQNGAKEDLRRSQWRRGGSMPWRSVYQWSQIHTTLMRNRIRIRITVKSKIRNQMKRGIEDPDPH
jgi:hypothetical protein